MWLFLCVCVFLPFLGTYVGGSQGFGLPFKMKGNRLCFPKIIALWHKNYFELIIFKKQQAQSGS